MKRLCAIAIKEKVPMGRDYLIPMLEAWKKVRADVCLVPESGVSCGYGDVPCMESMQEVLDYADETGCGELILMTDDLMGPVYPLTEFCQRAEACTDGVWYLARGAGMWGVRKEQWKLLQNTATVRQAMERLGRTEGAGELYDTGDLTDVTAVPMLDKPLTMVRDKKCPFFLHLVFHRNYGDVVSTTLGHQAQVFYRWLMRESQWDTNLLWDYLLANVHQEDYFWNMHLAYVLPTRKSQPEWVERHLQDHSLALVMHLYYPDKLAESCSFARRFPRQTHVIITTSSEEKKDRILQVFESEDFASLDVRVIENRGRDVSALLVGAAEVFDQYDYVCFFHDKKTLQTKPGSIGAGFAYKLQENLFASRDFVNNVLRTFAENPRLGMLSPTPPHHGDYFFTLALKWGPNYEKTKALADRLNFRVPIAPDKMPLSPLGTCFWFRGKSMKPLSDHGWKYNEFPPEPNGVDGTLLHAIERIYAFACVEAGYYPGFVLSDRYAAVEYSSMRYYVREFNRICIDHGFLGYHRDMCAELNRRLKNR